MTIKLCEHNGTSNNHNKLQVILLQFMILLKRLLKNELIFSLKKTAN